MSITTTVPETTAGQTVTIALTVTLHSSDHHEEHGGFTSYTFRHADEPGYFSLEIPDGIAAIAVIHPTNCLNCGHRSDCATHNEPSMPAGPCDCKKVFA